MLVAQIITGLLKAGAAHLKALEAVAMEEAVEAEHSPQAAWRTGRVKYGVLAMLMV
jgi:hypothetical protein